MAKVELYVYDLSGGLAKSMSLMLTGKQIDGIWHTSVVVFGREIFYGQGIMEARPGTTHHGKPLKVIECGETEIDPDTFQEYLTSLQELYTPSAYHLLDFNCNSFSADVIGFLTGATIPSWISGLPAEFLSTPFGQAMRPQIDAMFRQTSPNEHSISQRGRSPPAPTITETPSPTTASFASALLSTVAAQAAQGSTPPPPPGPSTETSPLLLVSSFSNFTSIINSQPAVIVNFTNTPGCAPCRAIKPAYEAIAATHAAMYGSKGARFVEIELGVGEGQRIAGQYGVTATPTFMFFNKGKKVDEMKGADKRGLENRVEGFLENCFPRHPHRKVYLPTVEKLSVEPLTSTGVPAYPALLSKLESFGVGAEHVKFLKDEVVPFLQGQTLPDNEVRVLVDRWTGASVAMIASLSPEQVFPVIDLWRVGLLNAKISTTMALRLSPTGSSLPEAITPFLSLTRTILKEQGASAPRPLLLTTLRLLINLLSLLPLANLVLSNPPNETLSTLQNTIISVLVDSLLHTDASVRKAASELALNVAGWRHRVGRARARAEGVAGEDEDGPEVEWEVEVLSALLEGVGREEDEEIAHRLLAAVALLVYLSPSYIPSLRPMIEVLGAKSTIETRISKIWKKKEVKKLAEELIHKVF